MNLNYQIMVLVYVAYLPIPSNCDLKDVGMSTQRKRYCGGYLTDALAAICRGNYNTLRPVFITKKSYWDSSVADLLPSSDYPFQTRQEATSMLRNYGRKRKRRGVYNECCEKSCSHEQLSMYCAAPAPAKNRQRRSSFFSR